MPSKSSVLGLPYINLASTWINTHISIDKHNGTANVDIFLKQKRHLWPIITDTKLLHLLIVSTPIWKLIILYIYIRTYNHSKTNKMIWSGQLVVNSSNIPTQPTREVLKDHHIETNQPTYLPPYRPRPWDHQWNICHHGPIPGILVIFKWLWFIGILKKLAEKKEDFTAASRHS